MSESPPAIPPETPVQPPQPIQAPPPRSNRKLILAVVLVIIAVGSVSGYIVYSTVLSPSRAAPKPSSGFSTYSNYGFSFQYPQGMTITERGLLDNTATIASGTVLGETQGTKYELILVAWFRSVNPIPLEPTLDGAFTGMSNAQGVSSVVKGTQGEIAKAGYRVLYQYFTITAGGRTSYGVYSVWYSTGGQRLYQLALTYYLQNTFPVYQRYIDSFREA